MHIPTTLLDDALADVETNPDTILVHRSGAFNFTPLLKCCCHLTGGDAFSSVNDMNFELHACVVISGHNFDSTVDCELKCILREIDKYLL